MAQIKITWNPVTEAAGYKVYYGTASRIYGTPINVGNVTTYTLNGLSPGVVYYIAATAYDTVNHESAYSNEVSCQITETVRPPTVLVGITSSTTGTSNTYTAGGSSSNLGHSVQYQFDWKGDATDLSLWGSTTQSKTWTVAGTYNVRARARCATHTSAVSSWSGTLSVTVAAVSFTVTPSDGLISLGSQGGPFSPSSKSYTLQNTDASSINWKASKGQAWTSLSSTGGTLAAGAGTTVRVSINSSANSLGVGSYSDTVTFTNTTNGNGNTTRPISLRVVAVTNSDLIISTLTGPKTPVAPGQVISLSEATKNQGSGATTVNTVTRFYWSTNSTLDAWDAALGQRTVGPLAAGAISGPVSTTVKIPTTAVSGTYYIIAKADASNSIAETSETNNTKYITVKIGPDLIVSTLTGPTTPVAPGQVISLSEATKNQGSRATTVNTVTRFYWSTNSTLDASDVALGQRTVGPLAAGAISGPMSTLVTIPPTALAGTYYIIAKADAGNSVAETSETNNTKYITVKVLP